MCSIRGTKDAPKSKDYILSFAKNMGSRTKAFALIGKYGRPVRFYLPFTPQDIKHDNTPEVTRKPSSRIGKQLATLLCDIAREHPKLSGIIDWVDSNATAHGQRDIDDDRLSNLIERISEKHFRFSTRIVVSKFF